jgi:hypothetical protein
MKIWLTRCSTWDLLSRGIDRCTLWLQKPFFDTTPRGKELDRICPDLPIGWRVLDPHYGDITGQVSLSVREAVPVGQYEDFANVLWEALCRSVDGKGPDEEGGALRRFDSLIDTGVDYEAEALVMSTFLFECDAPPSLWFSAAWRNGIEYQTAAGRWAQKIFVLDTDMEDEAPEPPPPRYKVIDFEQMTVAQNN